MKRVLLVTSAMHMPRALKIFEHQEIDTIAAPTDFLVSEQEVEEPYNSIQAFILYSLPDADRIAKTTKAICLSFQRLALTVTSRVGICFIDHLLIRITCLKNFVKFYPFLFLRLRFWPVIN